MDFELAETPLNKTEAVQVACDTLRHYYQDLNLGPIKVGDTFHNFRSTMLSVFVHYYWKPNFLTGLIDILSHMEY